MVAEVHMENWRVTIHRIKGLLRKRSPDTELDAEFRAHIELLAEDNIRKGMGPEEAGYAARREFGGLEQMKEIYRDQRGLPFFETLLQDARFGVRMLAQNRAFALVAIVTLAVGIGATSAVFSVVDRILFRGLPYPHQERLVSFGFKAPLDSLEFMLGTDYLEWRAQQNAFEAMTTMRPGEADCDLTLQNPARLSCAAVESTFLTTFEIQPMLGRNFTPEEDRPKASPVALLSYGLWRSRFAGDPAIVGKTIPVDGKPILVVGVLPASFEMPTLAHIDMLIPQALDEAVQRRPNAGAVLRTFARLKPGVTPAQAAIALQPSFERSLMFVPAQFRKEVSLVVRPLRDRQIHDSRLASWILLGSVITVLLVACTNVANLLLARAGARQRELAIRTALGASRARLIRQSLTESLLLSLLGGFAGCCVAYGLLRWFISLAPDGIPRLQQASLDSRVVAFTFVIALLSALLFGIAPALRRPAPELLTGKEARSTSRGFFRQSLMAAQIAASLVLLAGAGLLLRSLWKLQSVPLGMETESVITGKISLADYRYPEMPQQLAFFQNLETRLQQIPGASAVALSDSIPPAGGMRATIYARIEVAGRPLPPEGTGGMVGWRAVTPGYFSALRIPVLRGRAFEEKDGAPDENPIILNEALAQRLFPNEEALGKTIRFAMTGPWRTVVGIATNVKNNGPAEAADPEFYIPWKSDPVGNFSTAHVIIRTAMNPQAMAGWMRTTTVALDQALPIDIQTLDQRVGKLAQRPRFNALLLSLFAGIGLLLAAIGIYGVVGYLVAQRTREIGVRMALGAAPGTILGMVLLHVARWTIVGALLGLLGAWWSARLLESLLFEVRPHDPFLLGLALLFLAVVVVVAAWIPACRAMRVDPVVALRYE
jgi:putative ABC transport system permease protein